MFELSSVSFGSDTDVEDKTLWSVHLDLGDDLVNITVELPFKEKDQALDLLRGLISQPNGIYYACGINVQIFGNLLYILHPYQTIHCKIPDGIKPRIQRIIEINL